MAHEKKSSAGATFYKVSTLNKLFLLSSLAMTLFYVWSVVDDHQKPWKKVQREFLDHEWWTAEVQKAGVWSDRDNRTLSELFDAQDQAKERVATDSAVRPGLEAAKAEAAYDFKIAEAEMKRAKANFEAARFHYEELAFILEPGQDMWNPQTDELRGHLDHYLELRETYYTLDEASKAAEAGLAEAQQALDHHDGMVTSLQVEIDALEREIGRLERLQASVDTERPFTSFRNSIFFDFMAPNVKVRKVVVSECLQELNFLQMPRIDMCMTCHMGSDRFEDYPWDNPPASLIREGEEEIREEDRVFLAHSRPELFATSLSPHGQDRFGCTVCHQGNGQRLGFDLAFHVPTDEDERYRWEEQHHWHEPHYWDYPMLSSKHIESSCYKCHDQQLHIPGADRWNEGRDLVQRYGCFGCHNMKPFEGWRKTGPPLYNMVSKFQSPEWTLKWVNRPADFRPSTPMPQFFHLENRTDDPQRQLAEINSIVQYLYNLSTPLDLTPYPGTGDARRGKDLFGAGGGVGCLACHNINDFPAEDRADAERHGPELSGVGSKVTADWLFNWLRDPEAIWPDTNMPNLRLTEQEAADLTAYLMTKRNTEFDDQAFSRPAGGDAKYEEILIEKLSERMTRERAASEVSDMGSLQKRLLAGEYLVNHYGCFGCHMIAGYEDTKPIGTDLNGWGSKHADRLDFGVFEMEWKEEGKFNRESWLSQKLHNTRFFDRGKDRRPFENLKMPQFQFGPTPEAHDAAIESVMTYVLSLSKDHVKESIKRNLVGAEEAVERGKRIVEAKNCYGCHELYAVGGEIQSFIGSEDGATAYYPPLISGQGARTQHDWLFEFLSDPSMGAGRGSKAYLRPWMRARMPTFGFSQQELNDLVAYFAHEEIWQTAADRELWQEVADKFEDTFTGYSSRDLRRAEAGKTQLHAALLARNYKRLGGEFLHQTDFPYLADGAGEMDTQRAQQAKDFFVQLSCVLCHQPGGVPPEGKSDADMAPSLDLTRSRLQPKWVANWFRGPAEYQPGTRMTNFWPVQNDGTRQFNHDSIQDADAEIRLLRDYLFSPGFQDDYRALTAPAGGQ